MELNKRCLLTYFIEASDQRSRLHYSFSLNSTEIDIFVTSCLQSNWASCCGWAVISNRCCITLFDWAVCTSNRHCHECPMSAAICSLHNFDGIKLIFRIEISSPPAIKTCMFTIHCISIICPSCLPCSINLVQYIWGQSRWIWIIILPCTGKSNWMGLSKPLSLFSNS